MVFSRLAKVHVVEDWITFDAFGLMQQLGVIPTPEQTSQYIALAIGSRKREFHIVSHSEEMWHG